MWCGMIKREIRREFLRLGIAVLGICGSSSRVLLGGSVEGIEAESMVATLKGGCIYACFVMSNSECASK